MNPLLISSLIEQRIEKNGLIIYSKGIDFFAKSKLKRSQLNSFGSFVQKQYENHPQAKSKYFSFYLYYKAESEPANGVIEQYKSQIEFPNQIAKDAVTKEHMLLLYNIIEFEDKFKTKKPEELQTLLTQLMKFDACQKSLEEFLLFTYYKGVLLFYLGKYNESNDSFMNVIIDIDEEVGDREKYPFIHYLVLKNNLFTRQIAQMMYNQRKQTGVCDSTELIVLSKDMYFQFEKISPVNAVKMGLMLFDLYYEKNDYDNCYLILHNSYKLIKKMAFCGEAIDNSPELSLQIIAKLAYLSVFLLKEDSLKLAKKLKKKYLILEGFLKDISPITRSQYSFCVYILDNIISSHRKEAPLPSLNEYKALLHQPDINTDVYLINMYSMDFLDQRSMKIVSDKFENLFNTVKANKLLSSKGFLPCFFYAYNKISLLTKGRLTETNIYKQKENSGLIRTYCDYFLEYSRAFKDDVDLKEFFKLSYVKALLIKVAFCKFSTDFVENKLSNLRDALSNFDKNKALYLNGEVLLMSEYASIVKLKGDLELKTENYMRAANYYQEALKNMRSNKMKALLLYNIGICYYCLRDMRKAKTNINQSLSEYQLLLKDRRYPEAENKIAKIEKILKHINRTN